MTQQHCLQQQHGFLPLLIKYPIQKSNNDWRPDMLTTPNPLLAGRSFTSDCRQVDMEQAVDQQTLALNVLLNLKLILLLYISPLLYNPLRVKVCQPTAGITSTFAITELNNCPASLGLKCVLSTSNLPALPDFLVRDRLYKSVVTQIPNDARCQTILIN